MKVYISRKDNSIKAKLIEYNDKFKTYTVEFISGDRIGKSVSFSSSTIKRWWKETDEPDEIDTKDVDDVPSSVKRNVEDKDKLDCIDLYLGKLQVAHKKNVNMVILYTIIGTKKKRLAYIYRRKTATRFYMPNKYYDIMRSSIESYLTKITYDTPDVNFYVNDADLFKVLDIICCKGGFK